MARSSKTRTVVVSMEVETERSLLSTSAEIRRRLRAVPWMVVRQTQSAVVDATKPAPRTRRASSRAR